MFSRDFRSGESVVSDFIESVALSHEVLSVAQRNSCRVTVHSGVKFVFRTG